MPRQQPSRVPLGQAVRRLRDERDLTIEGLADAASVHWTYLSEIERGLANPTWDKLAGIATALDVPSPNSSCSLRLLPPGTNLDSDASRCWR